MFIIDKRAKAGTPGQVQHGYDQAELGHEGTGGGERSGKKGEPGAAPKRPKVQTGRITKTSGLYTE